MVQRYRYDSSINVDDSRLLFSIWYGEGEQSFRLNIRVSLAWELPCLSHLDLGKASLRYSYGWWMDREESFKQQPLIKLNSHSNPFLLPCPSWLTVAGSFSVGPFLCFSHQVGLGTGSSIKELSLLQRINHIVQLLGRDNTHGQWPYN